MRDEDGADTHTLIEGCRQPKKLIAVCLVVLFEPSVCVALDDAGGFGFAPNRVGAAGYAGLGLVAAAAGAVGAAHEVEERAWELRVMRARVAAAEVAAGADGY